MGLIVAARYAWEKIIPKLINKTDPTPIPIGTTPMLTLEAKKFNHKLLMK